MVSSIPKEALLALGDEFGTPLYIYHADTIRDQYYKLREAFSGCDSHIFYACKALTNISVLKYIQELGSGIDCSSINEVQLALKAGFSPKKILYTASSIAFSEIGEAQSYGVNINIDSFSNLEKFARKYGNSYGVGVRLRPGIMAGGNLKISTGHDKSKFGIPLAQLGAIKKLMLDHSLVIKGLHIHTGSDVKDAAAFLKGVEVLFEITQDFPDLEYLDLGGGFKVPYHAEDTLIDIAELGENICLKCNEFFQRSGKKLQLWLEPGKFLVSEAGYFLATVNIIKPTDTILFAGLNTGFNHLIRPMFYDAYHHIENISNPTASKKEYTIVGNICETDTFASDRAIAEIREGDKLLFFNAGAYGMEMASNYNSRLRPAEVLIRGEEVFLIRKREVLEDLLKNQVYQPAGSLSVSAEI